MRVGRGRFALLRRGIEYGLLTPSELAERLEGHTQRTQKILSVVQCSRRMQRKNRYNRNRILLEFLVEEAICCVLTTVT